MKRNLLVVLLCLLGTAYLSAQTSLSGTVTEEESGEPVIFGNVVLYQNGVQKSGTQTDFDGNYNFASVDPGTYDVEFSYVGFQTQRVTGVVVFDGKANKLDAQLSSGVLLTEVEVIGYKVPLVEQDNTTQGQTITSEQIRSLPTRNINALAATTAGLASSDEGGAISIRGSRSNATNYYVDGMRIQGSLIPESEIDQLQVITGGVEARYGDVTGGIISITTKGPSDQFSGGVEAETSEYLDDYGNSLVGVNLSGPIMRNKQGISVLGYRFAGRFTHNEDDDPSAVPVYRARDEVITELEADPITTVNGTRYVSADFLTNEDVNALDTRPFEASSRLDLTGKIDARFSDAIDVTLTGAYRDSENQFTPSENSNGSWRLLNSHNNPISYNENYRVNFRFRHRLGGSSLTSNEQDDNRRVSTIQNATYTLQAMYENNTSEVFDPRHGFNYFDYGYVGQFDVEYIPVFGATADSLGNIYAAHQGYREVLRGYDPTNSPNPVLSNYNNPFGLTTDEQINPEILNYAFQGEESADALTLDELYAINGRTSNLYTSSWGFHDNVGSVYNAAQSAGQEVIIFNANASFDIVPNGESSRGRHNIQLGIAYEQRTERAYTVSNPSRLWTAARQNANSHLQGIDLENADTIGMIELPQPFFSVPLLGQSIADLPDARFYRAIRESLGIPLTDFVNIDGLTPDQLSMDMFTAAELNDQFILSYYGKDYLGNDFDGTFNDFFTTRDAEDIRTFPVAPNRPLYFAGYLQDKFTFRDIIFRLGVRVDRYDANTSVLRDPYSLYAIQGASEFHNQFGGDRPGNIGDDFRVYTTEDNGETVQAYREGDDWYRADGTPVNGAQEIEGIRSGLVYPKYQDPNAHVGNYIKSEDFNPTASFQDYEVQFNVMPRLAFSFPISDRANFFAHYDILVQRPPSNTLATALNYYYFVELTGSSLFNNPNLRPERTVDYEVGFMQRLTNSSAIKISAYYKEMRDMIQSRVFFPVPIVGSYETYDNLDFGTTKGFSFNYDLRRTNNITINANYTLQFADGTGSDANSSRGLGNRGIQRALFPLSFDERHRINLVVDYRFPGGNAYNGPRIGGLDIFANAGVNLQTVAVSGRPYTARELATSEFSGSGTIGAINGARKPWNYTLNLRVDKNFKIGNGLGLNIYCRISNVLDRRNVINVYSVTGSPNDDGFLRGTFGQDKVSTITSTGERPLESYLASYQWRLLNPDFFSLPRRIFVGAIVDF